MHTFSLMSAAEYAAIRVPFAEVGARLAGVLEEHGVVVVEDVVSRAECEALEALFSRDLFDALDDPGSALSAAAGAGPEHESLAELSEKLRLRARSAPHPCGLLVRPLDDKGQAAQVQEACRRVGSHGPLG